MRTPNLQRLAEAGPDIHACVRDVTRCAPNRERILVRLYLAKNGNEANHVFSGPEMRQLPDDPNDTGYEVAAFGKVMHGAAKTRDPGAKTLDRLEQNNVAADLTQDTQRKRRRNELVRWLKEQKDTTDPDSICTSTIRSSINKGSWR